MSRSRYLRTRDQDRAGVGRDHQRYAALRDEYVVNLGYNTARAYAGDLNQLFDWALARGTDVLDLTSREITLYVESLLDHHYSANTVARKRTALRGFYALAVSKQARADSPMNGWGTPRRQPSPPLQPDRSPMSATTDQGGH
jgi:site-specific recombinase XerD